MVSHIADHFFQHVFIGHNEIFGRIPISNVTEDAERLLFDFRYPVTFQDQYNSLMRKVDIFTLSSHFQQWKTHPIDNFEKFRNHNKNKDVKTLIRLKSNECLLRIDIF